MEIQSRLAIAPGDYTTAGVKKCLAAAGLTAELTEDCAAGRITVTAEDFANPTSAVSDVLAQAESFMPAHLAAVFVVSGLSWEDWETVYTSWTVFDEADADWNTRDAAQPE